MHNALNEVVRRFMTGPRMTFRFAIANAMFIFLLAKELIAHADE